VTCVFRHSGPPGPLSNMPEFAAAFRRKAGDPMVRSEPKRRKVW
jgi:predicted metalloendopeptidase